MSSVLAAEEVFKGVLNGDASHRPDVAARILGFRKSSGPGVVDLGMSVLRLVYDLGLVEVVVSHGLQEYRWVRDVLSL